MAVGGREESIRVIGIDTPETDARRTVECFGREATARTRALLDGWKVRLVPDPTQGDRDTYGRLLRYVDREDGLDLGLELVRGGYAHEYTYDRPYARRAAYRAAQAEARGRAAGLWGPACGTTVPATPSPRSRTAPTASAPAASTRTGVPPATKDDCPKDHPIKGNRGASGWIYHEPARASYAGTYPEECFATAADALAAGYRAPGS